MALIDIVLPRMGEGVEEATVTRWFVEPGQKVNEDDVIVEVATDKVDSEIPSPVEGTVVSINFNVDDIVRIGNVLAVISTGDEDAVGPGKEERTDKEEVIKDEPEKLVFGEIIDVTLEEAGTIAGDINKRSAKETKDIFLSPLVKSIVDKEGITAEELATIEGKGRDGRITKDDIREYLNKRDNAGIKASDEVAAESVKEPVKKAEVNVSAGDEIVKMDRMRRLIADHMLTSKQTSPHVTSVVEADVTNIVLWREKNKDAFLKKYGVKLTYMPIFTEATAKAVRDFPGINASVDGDSIIIRKDVNIGIAVVLPTGNLIVPVVKNADRMNLPGLAEKITSLAEAARNNTLQPADITEGTFTLTNVGTFGNLMGTPIIYQPQVAILAVGVIEKKPAVLETPTGDVIAIRHKMYLSLSYDHRVVDGALGGGFLKRIAENLEGFDIDTGI